MEALMKYIDSAESMDYVIRVSVNLVHFFM
jgi:hypothetical protein